MSKLRAFAQFWYDFVVGDDWRIALGVVVALGLTAVLASQGVSTWWLLPPSIAAVLAGSVWRVARRAPVARTRGGDPVA